MNLDFPCRTPILDVRDHWLDVPKSLQKRGKKDWERKGPGLFMTIGLAVDVSSCFVEANRGKSKKVQVDRRVKDR